MNWTKKKYKSIFISESNSICLFHFCDTFSQDEESIITSLTQFIEYVSYKMPHYIIIEKSKTDFNTHLFNNFFKKTIDDLLNSGASEIYFIVSPERYSEIQRDRADGSPSYRGIRAFLDLEACIAEIKKKSESFGQS